MDIEFVAYGVDVSGQSSGKVHVTADDVEQLELDLGDFVESLSDVDKEELVLNMSGKTIARGIDSDAIEEMTRELGELGYIEDIAKEIDENTLFDELTSRFDVQWFINKIGVNDILSCIGEREAMAHFSLEYIPEEKKQA